jgi:hypothetical protein
MVQKIAAMSTKNGKPVLMRRNFIARLLKTLHNLFECSVSEWSEQVME